MPMEFVQTQTAIARINKELDGFGAIVEAKIVGLAVSNFSKNLVKYSRRLAPKETGALRKKIGFIIRFNTITGNVVSRVGVLKGKVGHRRPSRYYHIIHGGANPHREKTDDPATDNPLIVGRSVWNFYQGNEFAEKVDHPGNKGYFFLTKAMKRHGALLYAKMISIIRVVAAVRLRGFQSERVHGLRIAQSADNIGEVVAANITRGTTRLIKKEIFSFFRMRYVTMMETLPLRNLGLNGRWSIHMTSGGVRQYLEWSATSKARLPGSARSIFN